MLVKGHVQYLDYSVFDFDYKLDQTSKQTYAKNNVNQERTSKTSTLLTKSFSPCPNLLVRSF